jgi:hypothetical protein
MPQQQLTFDTLPVLDATDEAANIALLGKIPPADFAKANSLVNPLGREPAMGYLLLSRASLNAINLNGLHILVMDDSRGGKVIIPRLVIAKEPLNLTPSTVANDPKSAYLVTVADSRWRVANPYYRVMANKEFNVRMSSTADSGDPAAYYVTTMNTGSVPWTWLTLVQYLWGLMAVQLGAAPAALPFTPDGTPENWLFPGVPAWYALCEVLDKINCAVAWAPTLGTYSIVEIGDADPISAGILARAESQARKIDDAEPLAVVRGKVSESAYVYFRKQPPPLGQSPFVVITVPSGFAGVEPGTATPIMDDLPALYDDTGTLLNGADLNTRAAERAETFYLALAGIGGTRLRKIYSGIVPIAPGSTIRGVAWRTDAEGALITEVVRLPENIKSLAVAAGPDEGYSDSPPLTVPISFPVTNNYVVIANVSVNNQTLVYNFETKQFYWTSDFVTYNPVNGGSLDWTGHMDSGTSFGGTGMGLLDARWHLGQELTFSTLGSETMVPETIYATELISPSGLTISTIAVGLLTTVDANLIFAIFQDSGGGDKYPMSRVWVSDEIDLNDYGADDVPGLVVVEDVNYTLDPRTSYWLAIYSDGAPTIQFFASAQGLVATVMGRGDGGAPSPGAGVGPGAFNNTPAIGIKKFRTYDGTMPATFPRDAVLFEGTGGGDLPPGIGVQFVGSGGPIVVPANALLDELGVPLLDEDAADILLDET